MGVTCYTTLTPNHLVTTEPYRTDLEAAQATLPNTNANAPTTNTTHSSTMMVYVIARQLMNKQNLPKTFSTKTHPTRDPTNFHIIHNDATPTTNDIITNATTMNGITLVIRAGKVTEKDPDEDTTDATTNVTTITPKEETPVQIGGQLVNTRGTLMTIYN